MKPDNHAREHINGEREPRPLIDRLPCLLVDKEDIHFGVADLHDLERPGCGVLPWRSSRSLDALRVFSLQ
jgi:hypothetical protein